MKLDAGEPMFWIGDAVCTDKHNFMEVKCFRDTDADGRMETSYFAGYAPNLVLVLGSVGYREKAPSQAFRVETSTVADRFRHAIGIAVTGIRIDKASGAASVQLAVFLRNTSEPRWTWEEMRGQEQTLVIPKGGKGVYETLGARIEIEPAGPKSFNWKIVKPFPEQPLDGSTAVTGSTYFGAGVPMLRVEARAAATPMPGVLPPLRSGSR
jgi:hypothetical protein